MSRPKSWLLCGLAGVADEGLDQDGRLEQIDPHGDQALGRVPGRGERLLRLLHELDDAALAVDADDAEARGLLDGDRPGHDQGVGPGLAEEEQELAVIGVVDVVARKHEDGLRVFLLDGVDILEHRVGRALVPVVADPALGGQGDDEVAALGVEDVPAVEDVALEGQGLVLGQKGDPAQAGVEGVGQAEIDDPIGAEKGHGRLGPIAGQGIEPLPFAPAEDHGQGLLR